MVAEEEVRALAATLVICGAADVVIKVALPDVVDWLALLAETAAKSYVVPGVKPVSVTECEVANVLFSAEVVP